MAQIPVAVSPQIPISYQLRRSSRRSVGFRIDDTGLVVTAPRWLTKSQINLMVEEKRAWIEKHLSERGLWKKDLGIAEEFSLCDGGRILFRGKRARLRFTPGVSGFFPEGDEAVVVLPLARDADDAQVAAALEKFLRAEAQRVFGVRFALVSLRAPRPAVRWHLSGARHQWGSCTSAGVVSLSWRLIFFDDEAIDYVIAHELAHLVEMNHSEAFWQVVAEIDPDWERKREKIRRVSIGSLPI